MHRATGTIASVARMYAKHVPSPARAYTRGIVRAAEVLGAIAEIDCAKVSVGVRTPSRRPYEGLSPSRSCSTGEINRCTSLRVRKVALLENNSDCLVYTRDLAQSEGQR